MTQIYVSTGAFRGARVAEMSDACDAMGAGLELSSGVRPSPRLIWDINQLLQKNRSLLVHNYFPPPENPFVLNLAARDPATLEASRRHVRTAIDLSARCGAGFYSVHSGFALDLRAGDLGRPEAQAQMKKVPYAEALRIFRDSLQALSPYARSKGIRLLIENNVLAPGQTEGERPLLMTEPAEIANFLHDLADENIALLLDVAHAKVTAQSLHFDPADFFNLLPRHIAALHLSDNDGTRDTNQPFADDAWFAKHLPDTLPIVIEVYNISPDTAAAQVQLVKRWLQNK
jgi:sugar phosphate isomerase/epimerase